LVAAGGVLAVLMRMELASQIGAYGGERSTSCLLVSKLTERGIELSVFIVIVGTMLRRRRSYRKKHLRQICLYVIPKLPFMKLRYYNVSKDEGSNRLKDGMTF
jgi:hypothetical protein